MTIGISAVNTDPDGGNVATSDATAGSVRLSYLIDKVTYLGPGQTAC